MSLRSLSNHRAFVPVRLRLTISVAAFFLPPTAAVQNLKYPFTTDGGIATPCPLTGRPAAKSGNSTLVGKLHLVGEVVAEFFKNRLFRSYSW